MARRLFEGYKHAAEYAKYRPRSPPAVAEKIIQYLKEKITTLNHALDIGCGSGQSTALFASHFEKVTGIDVSQAQIEEAIKNNKFTNVEYKVSSAEDTKLENESIQLVAASQSVHWFDLDKFYNEVDRLLVPNGVLAMYGYSVVMPHPLDVKVREKAVDIVNKFYEEDIGKYWSPERKHVDNSYEDITFPYRDYIRTTVTHQSDLPLLNYLGYFTTWSSYQELLKEDAKKAEFVMTKFQNRLREVLEASSDHVPLKVQTEYFILMGRKDVGQRHY
ncbi:putative methyltransferase DDB_G0268948 isoform X1 [Centruroides vittatus]|uniref:putative methyltransferase DDB_G0268948 isoform X1 n=2 Tax=Centruroides vittatus TaxID=120091 RepID=UPI0035105D11